jgi:hypothetical protein
METVAPGVIGEGVTDVMVIDEGIVVTENETVGTPKIVALNVFVPAVVPVMNIVAARPCASVCALVGEACPSPAETLNLTVSCACALPNASLTTKRTESPALAPGVTGPGSELVLVSEAEALATTVTSALAVSAPMVAAMVACPTGPGAETCPCGETDAILAALDEKAMTWPDISRPFVSYTATESCRDDPAASGMGNGGAITMLPTTGGAVLPSTPPPPQDIAISATPTTANNRVQAAEMPVVARRIPYLTCELFGTHLLRISGQCVNRQVRALVRVCYIQVVKPRKIFLIAIP